MNMTVERVSYLHETEIDEFMNGIKHALRPEIEANALEVRRAVALVRNGATNSYRYDPSESAVIANLLGVESENVRLSFNKMDTTCTCGYAGWCSHRIAVVFHLYSQHHSLTEWLHEWRKTESQQMALSISERTPNAWIDVLMRLTKPLRTIGMAENPGVFIHESSIIDQKATPLIPFEYEWKPLFELYYRLHVLDAGWAYVKGHLGGEPTSFFYGKWYVQNWLTEQLGKLNDSVTAIGAKPKLFEADAFHERVKDLVRTFALGNSGLFQERFHVYRLFWQHLFPSKTARSAELLILANEDTEEARVFIAFFHLIQSEHDELTELVKHVSADTVATWLPLAQLAESNEETDALAIIMHALLPFIGVYVNESVSLSSRPAFVRNIDGLFEAADFSEELRESMFVQYGEPGVDVYADFLVERERFHEWAALMHRYGVSYDGAEAGGLRVALTSDPSAVLPLLHTFAMGFIKEKNRHSYRRAVKLFKQMKTGSKKSGKVDFWNQYIDTVREKNRRLRALMEEMEKGNLNL
ncbi:MAG TPA: SWIM zinc finger family protein [Sporosarcina psychrophila]|uniref:SWIM zinc finger family protein n=1 Tax=Sporosarcina psychrophila TaxID=1476 RepID=A0A921G363_SPOPS|nr:SWIM zinc finger family protein [Sporosarcina psychrophila]